MTTTNKNEFIDSLIFAFLRGELTPEEKTQLENWLAVSKSNKEYFRQIYLIWKASGVTSVQNEHEMENAYQKIWLHTYREKIRQLHARQDMSGSSEILSGLRKWVAVIVLSLVSGAALYYLVQQYIPSAVNLSKNEIFVPLGSRSKMSLPDGSEVWLNAGSKLSYNLNYGKKLREVNLTGEGYFIVAHRPAKPFIVHASKVSIKALGTEFNVKAYPDEDVIETILVKGSVEIDKSEISSEKEKSTEDRLLVLKPGEKARIHKKPEVKSTYVKIPELKLAKKETEERISEEEEMIKMQSSDAAIETSWKDERWIIKSKKLDDLLVLLSRRYNISISLMNKELSKYQFSGTIENETPEQVFKILSLTVPMSYSIDKGDVKILLNRELEKKYKSAYKE